MLKEKRGNVNARAYINALKSMTLPEKNEVTFVCEYDGITQLDIVMSILKGEKIDNLTIVSFRIPIKAIDLIHDARKRGLISKIDYYLSDSIPAMVKSTYNYLKNENVIYDNYHAKFTLIETPENSYVIQSSGNFHFEKDIEITTITNNKKLLKELKLWLEETKI